MKARFWITRGGQGLKRVAVFPGRDVIDPPPQVINLLVPEAKLSESDGSVHVAEFRLREVERSTDELIDRANREGVTIEPIAHYEIIPNPRPGWRWTVVDDQLRASRVKP